jgi:transcriptional regulator with XRE-family HTH domain
MPRKPVRRLPLSADEAIAGRTPTEQLGIEEFARRLQYWRIKRGFKNQSDLAREIWGSIPNSKGNGRLVAKNRDRISQYEMGRSWPSPHNLQEMAKVLGVMPEDLAPDMMGAMVERENPERSMVAVGDKTHLKVNKWVLNDQATRIWVILNEG